MNASPEEISAGQKAYQGLKAYERFKTSQQSKLAVFFNVLTVLFVIFQIMAGIYCRQYWKAALAAVLIPTVVWGLCSLENTKKKNFELLKQLKAKYGPEIYEAITKEPDSIQYKLFQKSYPPERRAPSVELP